MFLFSCSQIEFTLTEKEKLTPLKNKTALKVLNSPNSQLKEQLVFFFGENLEPTYHLLVDASENKTNRFDNDLFVWIITIWVFDRPRRLHSKCCLKICLR